MYPVTPTSKPVGNGMEEKQKTITDEARKIDRVIADRVKIEKLKASTEEVKA
jgi:hypothetical protein